MAKPRRGNLPVGQAMWRVAAFSAALIWAGSAAAQFSSGPFASGPFTSEQPTTGGTFDPGSVFGNNGPAPVTSRSVAKSERAAAHLLAMARKDQARGRNEVAQRVLEQLIARYPESSSVGDARRMLFSLYSSDAGIRTRQANTQTLPPPMGLSGRPAAERRSRAKAIGAWRTKVVSAQALQDVLRNTIGDRVFFSGGSANLGSRARAVLVRQARWLSRNPHVAVVIEGHADDRAAGADDKRLSMRRAAKVRDVLMGEGVTPGRLKVRGMGARQKVAVCAGSDCAAQNRRVVVRVGPGAGSHQGRQIGGSGSADNSLAQFPPVQNDSSIGVRR